LTFEGISCPFRPQAEIQSQLFLSRHAHGLNRQDGSLKMPAAPP
jgi:hypothetical protein